MKGFVLTFVSLCLFTGLQSADVKCPPGWAYFGISCYKFFTEYGEMRSWNQAQEKCKEFGANLAEVESEDETNFLQGIAKKEQKNFWLGGTDKGHEGSWIWGYSKKPLQYTNWGGRQPDDGSETGQNCLQLWSGVGYKWDDYWCYVKKRFICEIRLTCPDGWSYFGNSCYKLSSDKLAWEDAQDKCRQTNGFLSGIHTIEENNYLVGLVKSTNTNFWIGGTDKEKEGEFRWVYDGALFEFEAWNPKNPNNWEGKQDCVHLRAEFNFQWNDYNCNDKERYICQIKVVCPPGWTHHRTSCYKIIDDKEPWTAAQDRCKNYGGYLAEIESADETNYLENLAKATNAGSVQAWGYWVGGTDAGHEGKWIWGNSGKSFSYTHWYGKQPDDGSNTGQNCLQLWGDKGYLWDDYYCNVKLRFICEISSVGSGPVPC